MEEMKAVKNKKKGVIIGAAVGVLVLVVGVFFALFYESEEEYQARVVDAVEQKIETVMVTNEYWPMFTNKQHIIFRATICRDKGSSYCSNECYIYDIKKRTKELEARGSCFYTYLGTILLNDI